MAKTNIIDTPVAEQAAGVILENVATTEVVAAQEGQEVQEVALIAPDVFIAEDGSEYEFTVKSFLFKGEKYDVADAVANASGVLDELVKLKSFILKQK